MTPFHRLHLSYPYRASAVYRLASARIEAPMSDISLPKSSGIVVLFGTICRFFTIHKIVHIEVFTIATTVRSSYCPAYKAHHNWSRNCVQGSYPPHLPPQDIIPNPHVNGDIDKATKRSGTPIHPSRCRSDNPSSW